MRPTHWAKNVFVLAPVVFANRLTDGHAIARALLAFTLFCAAASAVYIFNDIRDREEDSKHPVKRERPLVSGQIGVATAAVGVDSKPREREASAPFRGDLTQFEGSAMSGEGRAGPPIL